MKTIDSVRTARRIAKIGLHWRAALPLIAVILAWAALPAFAVAADDAPAPPERATEQQIRAAEVKVRQLEIELLKARIELLKLKPESEISRMEEQVEAAEASLASLDPAAEGFIRNWLLLGPIALDEKVANHDEESCKAFLDRQYFPPADRPKEGDKVKINGAELEWKAVEAGEYFVDLSKLAEDAGKDAEHAAYLGIVYITCEQDMPDLKLAIGSDDDCVWRLNGHEVIRAYEGRAVDKDQSAAEGVTLKQGLNVLSFTVLNGDGPAAAAARFLDKDGNPVKGLNASATPPAP